MIKMKRFFFLFVYYAFARFLPPTNRNIVGKFGGKLRNLCCKHIFYKCGNVINIEHMAFFGNGKQVELGENSCIGIHCNVPNNIKIGEYVMMGPYCYFLETTTHVFDKTDVPIGLQGIRVIHEPTIVGDDVWIGRQCIVITGKVIGSHTIIGAGTVVCKNIPDYVVAAGNPVRVVKNRLKNK